MNSLFWRLRSCRNTLTPLVSHGLFSVLIAGPTVIFGGGSISVLGTAGSTESGNNVKTQLYVVQSLTPLCLHPCSVLIRCYMSKFTIPLLHLKYLDNPSYPKLIYRGGGGVISATSVGGRITAQINAILGAMKRGSRTLDARFVHMPHFADTHI